MPLGSKPNFPRNRTGSDAPQENFLGVLPIPDEGIGDDDDATWGGILGGGGGGLKARLPMWYEITHLRGRFGPISTLPAPRYAGKADIKTIIRR